MISALFRRDITEQCNKKPTHQLALSSSVVLLGEALEHGLT